MEETRKGLHGAVFWKNRKKQTVTYGVAQGTDPAAPGNTLVEVKGKVRSKPTSELSLTKETVTVLGHSSFRSSSGAVGISDLMQKLLDAMSQRLDWSEDVRHRAAALDGQKGSVMGPDLLEQLLQSEAAGYFWRKLYAHGYGATTKASELEKYLPLVTEEARKVLRTAPEEGALSVQGEFYRLLHDESLKFLMETGEIRAQLLGDDWLPA